ncbi:MAG: hypothetical protein C4K60_15415 [Ideonella sp. MAG2]|nr:MAG: hypothetical protein C4K60_15415 [Ideonella sp. MAG2]
MYWREESDAMEDRFMWACRPKVMDTWPTPLATRCWQWWGDLEQALIQGTNFFDWGFAQKWPEIRLFQLHSNNDREGFAARMAQWRALGAEEDFQDRFDRILMSQLPPEARVPGAKPP